MPSSWPTKNLGGFGDGGMVITSDGALAAKVRALREYGWDRARVSSAPGVNSRLDELQAALLRIGLRALPQDNARRARIAARYDAGLRDADVVTPSVRPGAVHAYHQYVCRSSRRDALRAGLLAAGVETAVHYPVPAHLQPCYAGRVPRHAMDVTERLAREIVSLPMHPWLTDDEVETVVREVASRA